MEIHHYPHYFNLWKSNNKKKTNYVLYDLAFILILTAQIGLDGMYEGKNIHHSEDKKLLCSFSAKLCKQRRINGFGFCIRHVLEDKSAPFRQCSFVAKYNHQQCTNAIPIAEQRK